MLCDQCHERDAVLNLTQIVENAVTQLHLCEKCAAERGIETTVSMPKHPLGDFLEAVQQQALQLPGRRGALRVLRHLAARFPRERPAGVRAVLRRVRAEPSRPAAPRAWERAARRPVATRCRIPTLLERDVSLGALRARLQEAIESEEFEMAARLRDRDPRAGGRRPMTLDLSLLPDGGVPWLAASGEHADIVLSSRIRFARNVAGYAFTARARDGERLRVLAQVREAMPRVPSLAGAALLRLDEMTADRAAAAARAAPREQGARGARRARPRRGAARRCSSPTTPASWSTRRTTCACRCFARASTSAARSRRPRKLDRELGGEVPYAFHHEFGFLTSCPTNTGTGMRASVLIHLPGLVLTQEIAKVLQGLQQMGLTYRGLYGEGSEVVGNFFQISNQTTHGAVGGRAGRAVDARGPARDRAGGGGAAGAVARRRLYYRGQAVARVRHAAARAQPARSTKR